MRSHLPEFGLLWAIADEDEAISRQPVQQVGRGPEEMSHPFALDERAHVQQLVRAFAVRWRRPLIRRHAVRDDADPPGGNAGSLGCLRQRGAQDCQPFTAADRITRETGAQGRPRSLKDIAALKGGDDGSAVHPAAQPRRRGG